MRWVSLNFGKHAGKILPQIILSDADWFFWALNKGVFKGRLANEAAKLVQRARVNPSVALSRFVMHSAGQGV
jgi:hypothetical protein